MLVSPGYPGDLAAKFVKRSEALFLCLCLLGWFYRKHTRDLRTFDELPKVHLAQHDARNCCETIRGFVFVVSASSKHHFFQTLKNCIYT